MSGKTNSGRNKFLQAQAGMVEEAERLRTEMAAKLGGSQTQQPSTSPSGGAPINTEADKHTSADVHLHTSTEADTNRLSDNDTRVNASVESGISGDGNRSINAATDNGISADNERRISANNDDNSSAGQLQPIPTSQPNPRIIKGPVKSKFRNKSESEFALPLRRRGAKSNEEVLVPKKQNPPGTKRLSCNIDQKIHRSAARLALDLDVDITDLAQLSLQIMIAMCGMPAIQRQAANNGMRVPDYVVQQILEIAATKQNT